MTAGLEMQVTGDYAPGWKAWEGLRDFVQNAKDGEVEYGAPMTISYDPDKLTMTIRNAGVTVPDSALLFGFSSKRNRSDLIGEHGEGLKLAMLAFARMNVGVRIRNGAKLWLPQMRMSERFGVKVLFLEERRCADKNDFQVEVTGVSPDTYRLVRNRFLFLRDQVSCVKTPAGDLLLSTSDKGAIYVKDVYVMYREEGLFGYNLKNAATDRDRGMVESYDLRSNIAAIWTAALEKNFELTDKLYVLMKTEDGAQEVYNMMYQALPDLANARLVELFKKEFGENALPVQTTSESMELAHLGRRGVVVPDVLRRTLERTLGTATKVKDGLKRAVVEVFGWESLTEPEQRVYTEVRSLMKAAGEDVEAMKIDVVRFGSDAVEGMFATGTQRISVARPMLASVKAMLTTVVHEWAHRKGGDGDVNHVREIERLWSELTMALFDQAKTRAAIDR